jgi:hypothetical protein
VLTVRNERLQGPAHGRCSGLPHYAGSELRHETRELIVFGVGAPTGAMVALIREAPSSIRVAWQEAVTHSRSR